MIQTSREYGRVYQNVVGLHPVDFSEVIHFDVRFLVSLLPVVHPSHRTFGKIQFFTYDYMPADLICIPFVNRVSLSFRARAYGSEAAYLVTFRLTFRMISGRLRCNLNYERRTCSAQGLHLEEPDCNKRQPPATENLRGAMYAP